MINNLTIRKAATKKNIPLAKKIRAQPRHQIRSLLRSFEPLETFRKRTESKSN